LTDHDDRPVGADCEVDGPDALDEPGIVGARIVGGRIVAGGTIDLAPGIIGGAGFVAETDGSGVQPNASSRVSGM
jgi:hypothetical protein